MAISKQQKEEALKQYGNWISASRAVILTEYSGLTMKDLDQLRQKMRDVGAEFHIVKNTLGKIAIREVGYSVDENIFSGSTAIGFAFEDAPGAAKVLSDFANSSEFVKIKGGYLGSSLMNAEQVKALAEMPPLPVMRAQLLGIINAPASKLVRILAEPGRQIAAVIKAFSEKDAVPVET